MQNDKLFVKLSLTFLFRSKYYINIYVKYVEKGSPYKYFKNDQVYFA